MSGHSKWSTIKHKKQATDARRGQLFTRLAREIQIAARDGGDPDMNVRLRLAMDKARAANMPRDNIDRAIKRGTGELKGDELHEILYEAYGPNGVALLIMAVTDNRNRSTADVRRICNKNGGSLAEPGAVAWQFKRKGYIALPASQDGDRIFEIALDANAEDVIFGDEITEIYTDLESFQPVQRALESHGVSIEDAEIAYVADLPVSLPRDEAFKVMRIVDQLEELDDVQQVFSTLDVDDALVAAYEDH
jgi:YebC/PmpR family DNA-binding regulatory protein